MSFNPNFYNNFSTFQNNVRPGFTVPPPPPPPFFPPFPSPELTSDESVIQTFESKIAPKPFRKQKKTILPINETRRQLRNLVTKLSKLKEQEKYLQDNIETITETEWNEKMKLIAEEKVLIEELMGQFNDTHLDGIKNALAKRAAKRMRLKRVKSERKKEKEDRQRHWEEKERKIDENLQKIKDDILKAKQQEEIKAQTDIVLREVSRRKQDAKKCVAKLDAMVRLRKAREDTARGRGVHVSDTAAAAFNGNIEKIKAIWLKKLEMYEKEEADLRAKLSADEKESSASELEQKVVETLRRWSELLFGSAAARPQVDFQGDAGRFVAVRCAWDQFISSEGTPMPVGWVLPNNASSLTKDTLIQ